MKRHLTGSILILAAISAGSRAEDKHEEHHLVKVSAEQLASLNLGHYLVQRGSLKDTMEYPVEIHFDPNRVAHLTPRVSGVVSQVRFGLGDRVKKGDILATLESRELGMANSAYLAGLSRQRLREKTFAREKRLWERKISAEQDYLAAELELQESRIETEMARQALLALGITEDSLKQLAENKNALNRYAMVAPFDGIIIKQHITLGEVLKDSSKAFVMIDSDRVWAMAQIFERDIRRIKPGQRTAITISAFPGETFVGEIDYVGSQLDEASRTVVARVILSSPENKLRAGMFGRLTLFVEQDLKMSDTFLLPRAALQRSHDGFVVFKQEGEGVYEQVKVQLVSEAKDFAEVIGELSLGDIIATGDTFILKSLADKEALGGSHAH